MLFLRARSFLRVCSDRPEARSPRTVLSLAGDSSLAFSQNPAVLRGTAGWLRSELLAGLAPWLQSPRLQAPVSSAPTDCLDLHLLQTSTYSRLQLLSRLAFSAPLYGVHGRGLIFHLRPPAPRWLRPFCYFDPLFVAKLGHARMLQRSAPTHGRCRRHWLLFQQGTPASVGGDAVRSGRCFR